MKIDRHNYEEFFILYMDNELTQAERRMVDIFVSHHPDLKEELEQLLYTKLSPDTTASYNQKENLFKHSEATAITAANYEDWLLSYVDEELSLDEEKKVELFVAANPSAQQLLKQLQQAKNQPETSIVFPDKEILYRSAEEKKPVKPLFILSWQRIAAAIVILLGLSAGLASILTNEVDKPVTPIAQVDPIKETIAQETGTSSDTNTNSSKEQTTSSSLETQNTVERAATTKYATQESALAKSENNTLSTVEQQNDPQTLLASKEITQEENAAINERRRADLATALVSETKEVLTNHKEIYSHPVVTPAIPTSLDIQAASFVPADTEDVATQAGNKNKLRGFFRKLTRGFEKVTNIKTTDDENRLLIAGLAIQL